ENILKYPPNKRRVNTIFQNYALFPHLSVFENVAFPLRLKKLPEKQIRSEVAQYLSMVRLSDHGYKKPAQLSGGMKQRVAIARALVNQPDVLLLDEPLSALDAKLRQHMLIELDGIHDDIGITFIYVTHDQQEALSVSDRIAILDRGKILQVGTPTQIYESPSDAFVADFIGETNFVEGVVSSIEGTRGKVFVEGTGDLVFDLDKPVTVGDRIKLTIRPEKIRVTKEAPLFESSSDDYNVVRGFVDEVIYTGFQSKYFIKTPSGHQVRAFKQHIKYHLDETPINWKEDVYLSWNYNDGYLVEVQGR
ncbi:MAG: ABC transporter ATP-binding protein, partial [Spirochaetota bacterium]